MTKPFLIACVHATRRAVEPARRMLAAHPGEFEQSHLVEEALLTRQGGPDGFEILLQTLGQAEQLRPAAILTTCSMYTPHLPAARRLVATPIVGVDETMLDDAARLGGPLALVGSLETSLDLAAEQIGRRALALRIPTSIVQKRLVPVDACETNEGTKALADELCELARQVKAVVVVQLSLSPIAEFLSAEEQQRILVSSRTALAHVRKVIEERTS